MTALYPCASIYIYIWSHVFVLRSPYSYWTPANIFFCISLTRTSSLMVTHFPTHCVNIHVFITCKYIVSCWNSNDTPFSVSATVFGHLVVCTWLGMATGQFPFISPRCVYHSQACYVHKQYYVKQWDDL